MPDGVGKSAIARRYFLQGFTSVHVISNPANSTSSCAKQNLSGLRVMPVSLREGDRMVAVPGVKDCLLSVHWDGSGLVERGLGVVRLPGRVLIELLEVNGVPEGPVLLGPDYHSVAPTVWEGLPGRHPCRGLVLPV